MPTQKPQPKRKLGRLPLPISTGQWRRAGRKICRRQYDDRLLVELIARGDLAGTQIAAIVGLHHSMVYQIASGIKRPGLQPLIAAARRRHNRKEIEMNETIKALAESAPPVPQKHKTYDDNELVEMLAAGTLTFAQIGQRVGLTQPAVYRISKGKMRPDLLPRIREAQEAYRDQARRIGTAHLRNVVGKHLTQGIDGDDETARKCREYIMDNALGEGPGRGRGRSLLCSSDVAQTPPHENDAFNSPEMLEMGCIILNGPDLCEEATALAELPTETKHKIVKALRMAEE